MKISLEWLSDFVDLGGISPEDLAEKLTVHTAETEGFEVVRRSVHRVVVGRIAHVEPLTDKATYVTVDAGGAGTFRTVCGAPNVALGMKAALALPGARLAGGAVVQEQTVHGQASAGMLCSPAELGLGESHEGLLQLPAGLAAGTPLADLIPAEDVLVEIDNKSLTHRPDLWGHYGFARELSAIFERPLKALPLTDLSRFDHEQPLAVSIEDGDGCPFYSAIAFSVDANPVSPLKMQSRLLTLGLRTSSLLVDVTNYVQLELGQPTHAFDAAHVGSVRVAAAGAVDRFTTLDGRSWALQPQDLLIFDADRNTPVALAGIMGGQDSQVQPETRNVVLESANFKGSRIRHTSVRLPLRTDASLRFEKKLPPLFARMGSARILHLLEEAGVGVTVTSAFSAQGDLKDAPRHIDIPSGFLSRHAGAAIANETARHLLQNIGFGCEIQPDGGLRVAVPPFRSEHDISIVEDLSEEVMRLFGYDNITPRMPEAALTSAPINPANRAHHRMRRVLAEAHRFIELHTYGWISDDWAAAIGHEFQRPLVLVNPIGPERSRMRDALLPNLFAAVEHNRRIRDDFRVFELGKVFAAGEGGQVAREWNELGGVSVVQSGALTAEQHFRDLRGVIDDLFRAAGLAAPAYTPFAAGAEPWRQEGLGLDIHRDGTVVGALGLAPPKLRGAIVDSGHVVWFMLRCDEILGEVYPATDCRPIPVYPASWQDFTFEWPIRQGYGALETLLGELAHPLLSGVSFCGFFRPDQSESGKYTFRFLLRRQDGTLSPEDIEGFRHDILAFIERNSLKLA